MDTEPLTVARGGAQLVAHHGQELGPHPLKLFELSHVLHGHDEGLHLTVLGVDGRGVEQHGDAPSVGDPEDYLLGAHGLPGAQQLGYREFPERDLPPSARRQINTSSSWH